LRGASCIKAPIEFGLDERWVFNPDSPDGTVFCGAMGLIIV
jgi:hypothetical protein